ncbi:MAG: multidrug efflux RND transporter permease subunit [Alphaproteobacteria bacterium]|nr:multidrug efflux RND transporter permease subunit [Alphaproteobacteria bacterium]
MFSRIFIKRPRLAIVISLVITIAGLISMSTIPVSQLPDVVPPSVKVSAKYPGASAEVIEQTVAQTIEQQVNGVDDMLYMESESSNDGTYSLTVTFALGTNPDMNTVNVQNRISQVMTKLPYEVQNQGITVKKRTSNMLLGFSIYSPDGSRGVNELANYMSIRVKDVLSRVRGVGEVNTFGDKDYSMRIWLDPQKLANLGLSNAEVVAAIETQNIQPAIGSIGAAPSPTDQQLQLTIKTTGRLSTPEEFGNIIIRANKEGGLLRLKDIARIELGTTTYSSQAYFNGQNSAGGVINLAPGANAMQVAKGVKAELQRMRKFFPDGMDYAIVFDTTLFIESTVDEVISTIFEAFILVLLTVYLSLGTWRATLIPAFAVPVSLIGTFIFMQPFGISANTISLLSIVLVIGIVVDDAIMVVENVERVIDEDKDKTVPECVEKAMGQITAPIVAITLVILSVFVPVIFIPGITGQLFKQFAVTVSCSMVISAINALSLSPALCAVLLHREEKKQKGLVPWVISKIDSGRDGYTKIVRKLVKHSKMGLVIIGTVIFACWNLNEVTPSGFLPDEDQGMFMIDVQLPNGASLDRTKEVLSQMYQIIKEHPAVDKAMQMAGHSMIGGAGPNMAMTIVGMKPFDMRKDKSLQVKSVIATLQPKFNQIQGALIRAFNLPAIPGIGNANGFDYRLQNANGESVEKMESVMHNLLNVANADPMYRMVYSTFSTNTPQLYLELDRVKAQILGVNITNIFYQLQTTLGYRYINDFMLNGRVYQVNIQGEADARAAQSDIEKIYVKNDKGDMVPLRSLIKIRPIQGPLFLNRYNNMMTVKINGSTNGDYSSGQAIKRMEEISNKALPKGYEYEWTGMSLQEKEASGQMPIILGLAFLFAYFFLVALYESWMIPVPVLLSVSVALMGAFVFLLMTGLDNNVYAQIGMVLLIAQASKNAILIVEFAKDLREQGIEPEEAAGQAAYLRFRAVMMTAVSFILGLWPLVIASGAGALARRGVGTTVFGGMIFATAFGIFVVPMLFVVVVKRREKFHSRRQKRIALQEQNSQA